MSRYHDGVHEAVASLDVMDVPTLLTVLDSLYGRDGLLYGDGHREVLNEARKQVYRDFEIREAW